jgi:PAS domain S-box-containing protein
LGWFYGVQAQIDKALFFHDTFVARMEGNMNEKELLKQIEALKREVAALSEVNERLRESEEKFKTIFDNANDEIAYVGADGTIIDINPRVEQLFGYTREETIGKKIYEFLPLLPEEWQKLIGFTKDVLTGKSSKTKRWEFKAIDRNGEKVYLEANPQLIKRDGKIVGIFAIFRDVSQRKHEEELLLKTTEQLDKLLQERTSDMKELDTALKVMLKRIEGVKTEIRDQIIFNVSEFVLPYLEKIKKTNLNEVQRTYLNSLEKNLNDITAPILRGVSTKYLKLTPTEIQVANLIKQGKDTKEIAGTLFMSARTIETHRYNIRNKLGLKGKKLNLRTYLTSLE